MKGVLVGFSENLNKILHQNCIFRDFITNNTKNSEQKECLEKSLKILDENKGISVKPVSFLRTTGITRDFNDSPLSIKDFVENVPFKCVKGVVINEYLNTRLVSNKRLKDSLKSLRESKVNNKNSLFQIMDSVRCRECDYETFFFCENAVVDCSNFRKDLCLSENIERVVMSEEYIYKECKYCGKEFTTTEHRVKKTFTCLREYLVFVSDTGNGIVFDEKNSKETIDLSRYCEMNVDECVYNLEVLCENLAVYKKKY